MDLSETIIAAMIGALATVGTALFQLFTAIKSKGRVDLKPKRTTARSIFAIFALMVASAGGGFLYSQFLQQRAGEDIRAMRQELRELRDLTASQVMARREPHKFAAAEEPQQEAPVPTVEPTMPALPVSLEAQGGVAESIAYVPACRGSNASFGQDCDEASAQRIALCGTVPAAASVGAIRFFAQPDAVQRPWDEHAVELEADLGGARFTGKTFEYSQGASAKAVCVNFLHWSGQRPHIARIVVEYSLAPAAAEIPLEGSTPVETVQTTVQAAPAGGAFGGPATTLR